MVETVHRPDSPRRRIPRDTRAHKAISKSPCAWLILYPYMKRIVLYRLDVSFKPSSGRVVVTKLEEVLAKMERNGERRSLRMVASTAAHRISRVDDQIYNR